MKYWHDLSETGATVCMAWAFFCSAATVVLCSLYPQPRPARVMQCLLLCFVWQLFVLPLIRSVSQTVILSVSRASSQMDGILTLFPSIMEFISVGVQTPEFLAWRAHRIVQEEQVLRRIHREPPIVGAPRRKISQEAGEMQETQLDSKGNRDGEVIRTSFRSLPKNRQSGAPGGNQPLAVEDVR